MDALKIIKDIQDTNLEELKRFYGKKVEIIILPYEDRSTDNDSYSVLFDIINRNQGEIKPYTREDLYER